MLKKLLREPLLHFALLGAAIFIAAALVGGGEAPEPERERILVTTSQIDRLRAAFGATRGREPTADELATLIDEHVREEALFREAIALGLERDDGAIRARLAQKMRFLGVTGDESLEPTDERESDCGLSGRPSEKTWSARMRRARPAGGLGC